MADHKRLVRIYIKTQSFADTGRQVGISRQRVEQILNVLLDPGVEKIRADKRAVWHAVECIVCHRSKADVKMTSSGKCVSCYAHGLKYPNGEGKRARLLLRSPYCLVCKRTFTKAFPHVSLNMCSSDYTKNYRKRNPVPFAKRQQYFKANYQRHKEKITAWQKAHYIHNRERYKTRHDAYVAANRDKVNEYNRNYKRVKRGIDIPQEG